jgi:sporulation and spore germination protein/immunoglobulin-like protein involved in spore germination
VRRFLLPLLLTAALVAGAAGANDVRAAPGRRVPVAVYLVRSEHVSPVRRLVTADGGVARATLTALLRGRTAAERKAGYSSSIPTGTAVRGVVIRRGVATVDLSGRFAAGGGSLSMLLRVAQVVHTVTQFPTVDRVAFRIDGKPVTAIGGEGVVVSPPVGRKSFEGQAPPILVEQPLPGDVVAGPIGVRGTANVFEARLVAELRSTGGTVLARRLVDATSGTGTRGTFATSLPLRAAVSRAVVYVYARSPKDGHPIDVVRVPVSVLPAA